MLHTKGPAPLPASTQPRPIHTAQRCIWVQRWYDMLFLHWRVRPAALCGQVPNAVEIDERDGAAWVSLVLFRLQVRPAWLPFMPGFSHLTEVNLRTYVRFQGQPGISFLSVHAQNRWAMFLARLLTPMPYQWAAMSYERLGDGLRFSGSDSRAGGFRLELDFRTSADPASVAADGTLDAWLLERYRLFIADGTGRLLRADVNHPRWHIASAAVSVLANTCGRPFGLDLARAPDLAHFSAGVQARFGAFADCCQGDLPTVNQPSFIG